MKLIREYENLICRYQLFKDDKGVETWYCQFLSKDHPVNKKLFKMSGAEQ